MQVIKKFLFGQKIVTFLPPQRYLQPKNRLHNDNIVKKFKLLRLPQYF